MKFLVPNYNCLQNPWLGSYRPQIPILSVFCPQLNLNPPSHEKKFLGTPLPISSEFLTFLTNLLLTYLLTYLLACPTIRHVFCNVDFSGTFASHFWISLTWLATHFRRCILLGSQKHLKSELQTNWKWMKLLTRGSFHFCIRILLLNFDE